MEDRLKLKLMIEINKYIKVPGIVRLPHLQDSGKVPQHKVQISGKKCLPPADEDLLQVIVQSVQTENSTRCTDDSGQLMKVVVSLMRYQILLGGGGGGGGGGLCTYLITD